MINLKKIILTIIFLSFATVSFAQTKMRITLQLPLKSNLGENLTLFKQEIEKRSDIKVEIYDSSQLYRDSEVPQAVGSGAVEAGTSGLTQYASTNPEVDIFDLPFLFNTEEKVRKGTAPGSEIRKILDSSIAKTGSTVLYYQAYGGAIILTKGKPYKTPADFKDKKVRTFGKTLGEFVETLGGKPTMISASEQYLAYQRGTVDAGMTGVVGVQNRKLWEVMDTITVTNHSDIEFIVVVNTKWFNSLNDKQKTAIKEASLIAEKQLRDDNDRLEKEAFKVSKENKMNIVTLSKAETDAFKKA
ncbi:MAG: TRAP transporter substrate-binding protein DctP, partial [Candidatus Fonsibacter sp.]